MSLLVLYLIALAVPLSADSFVRHSVPKMNQPSRKCYSSKATCVPIEFCPKIFEVLNRHLNSPHKRHRNSKRPHEVTCRECPQYDGQLSVLCEPQHLSKFKNCIVAGRNVTGQCLPEEYCRRPAAKSHRKGSGHDHGMSKEKTCFEEDTKNYYCCPRELHSKKPIPDGSVANVYSRCRDSNRQLGRCVPVLQCDRLNQLKSVSTKKAFMHKNRCQSDDLTGHGRSICCVDAPGYTSTGQFDWITHPKATRLGLHSCGSMAMGDNIFRGTKAAFGQYPWMVNLLYKEKGQYKIKAAGTLIHPRYVLTAAHAITWNLKKIRLGDYDLDRTIDYCEDEGCAKPAQEYPIHKGIVHEHFEKHSNYDIALLELYRNVKLLPQQIYPICLPLTKSLLMLQPRQMTVTGWGWSDRYTSVLLEADMEVVNREQRLCPAESTFCTRGQNWSGHCRGDSGGPYQAIVPIRPNEHRHVQFGVISAGNGRCTGTKQAPNVGVSVAYHIKWILDHMNI